MDSLTTFQAMLSLSGLVLSAALVRRSAKRDAAATGTLSSVVLMLATVGMGALAMVNETWDPTSAAQAARPMNDWLLFMTPSLFLQLAAVACLCLHNRPRTTLRPVVLPSGLPVSGQPTETLTLVLPARAA